VDQRQGEADGDGREPRRGAAVGGAHDDVEEDGGQERLGDQDCGHRVAGGGVGAVAVGGHVADAVEAVLAGGDGIERGAGGETADDLRGDIGGHVLPLEALADGEADGDGRVEVGAGDVADGIRHRQDREAEGEGDTEEADAELHVAGVTAQVEGGVPARPALRRCCSRAGEAGRQAMPLCLPRPARISLNVSDGRMTADVLAASGR
jgi:hypothetical protein